MSSRDQSNKKPYVKLLFTLIFIIVILSSVLAIREFNGKPIYPNGESYFKLRIAKELTNDPLYGQDNVQEREYYPNLHNFFIANLINVFGEKNTTYFAPVLLGLLFALAFYRLLVNLSFPKNNANFAAMLMGVTPTFIASYSDLSGYGFTALLSLVSLTFYFEKDYWDMPWKISGKLFFAISILFLSLLAVTSIVGFVMTLLFLFIFSFFESRSLKSLALAISGPIIIFFPLAAFTSYAKYELKTLGFHRLDITEIFSIFGSTMGLDIFLMFLFCIGLIMLWRYFPNLRLYHFLAVLLVFVSFFNPLLRLYASMLITVYCVIAIKHLYYNKWELESVKSGTVILLVCALVFSSLNQVSSLVNSEPEFDATLAALALKNAAPGTVMTDPKYGFFIQYMSGKKTMLDGSSQNYADYHDTLGDYGYMLTLSRLKEAEPMIIKHNIKYVLITPNMKQQLWDGKEKELLLLLRNSGKFTRLELGKNQDFELWKYIG